VGCKGRKTYPGENERQSFTLTMWDVKVVQEKSSRANDERFTLTMWDVKIEYKFINLIDVPGFTLTMWDVKQKWDHLQDLTFSFYLNYVGCKGCFSKDTGFFLLRFTLTMWDVKKVPISFRFLTIQVLP